MILDSVREVLAAVLHWSAVVNCQLLIGYETGLVVLWDLKERTAECRYNSPEVSTGTLQAHSLIEVVSA